MLQGFKLLFMALQLFHLCPADNFCRTCGTSEESGEPFQPCMAAPRKAQTLGENLSLTSKDSEPFQPGRQHPDIRLSQVPTSPQPPPPPPPLPPSKGGPLQLYTTRHAPTGAAQNGPHQRLLLTLLSCMGSAENTECHMSKRAFHVTGRLCNSTISLD